MKEAGSPALWLESCEPLSELSIPLAFLYPCIEWKRAVPAATLEMNRASPCCHGYRSLGYVITFSIASKTLEEVRSGSQCTKV